MRIGFVELVLLLFIASITVGPNVALFADRWLRRAQRTSAAAARRKAQLEAQAAIEREALMTRFRVASNIFALLMLAALAYGLLLRPIDTPPKAYTAPDVRQDTDAAQTALSADSTPSGAPSIWVTTCSTEVPQLSCRARQSAPPEDVTTVSHKSPSASKAKLVNSPSTDRMAA